MTMDSPCTLPFRSNTSCLAVPATSHLNAPLEYGMSPPASRVGNLAFSRDDCAYSVQSHAGKAYDNPTRFIERLPKLTADHITTHSGPVLSASGLITTQSFLTPTFRHG